MPTPVPSSPQSRPASKIGSFSWPARRRRRATPPFPMTDFAIRQAAFARLAELKALHGPVLSYQVLKPGFEVGGERVAIIDRRKGIFKPRQCDFPLSVRTSPSSPYADGSEGDSLIYKYRGRDPSHRDNAGLRSACLHRIPIIYFFTVSKAQYLAEFPVYVVHDDPSALAFTMQIDYPGAVVSPDLSGAVAEEAVGRRRYLTTVMRTRLHQTSFRERVLSAYRSQCALCRLRLRPLLDAAHIQPDSEGGKPVVSNGLALCKIHHTAFDKMFLGIRRDRIIQVHREVREEKDGPMLRYGLQQLHDQRIQIPRRPDQQPDPALLAARYAQFQQAQLHL